MAKNIWANGWNYELVMQVMNGIPKVALGSQLNFISLLYLLFPPFAAYVINIFLIHSIAFFGMWLLLKKLSPVTSIASLLIIYGTSLCFAILDFWPSGGLSVAGQPLILYTFITIMQRNASYQEYCTLFLFPLYSSLVLSGAFIVGVFGLWLVVDLFRTKRLNYQALFSLVILFLIYLGVEYALVKSWFFDPGFISHRTEFLIALKSNLETLKAALNLLLYGLSSHANVYQFPIILCSVFAAVLFSFLKKNKGNTIFYTLLAVTVGLALVSSLQHWDGFTKLKESYPFFVSFDFSRFSWLLPTVFYLLFFFSLNIIAQSIKRSIFIISLLLVFQTGLEFKRNGADKTLYSKITPAFALKNQKLHSLSYRQYYSTDLFKNIKTYIGIEQDKYRILCLGIDPGVLQYNGFYTLDAYIANYPLNYKHEFRKIIEKELAKNETIKHDFDTFGSTCYLFSSELIKYQPYTKLNPVEINNLEINTSQAKILGGSYIVSAVKINNAEQLDLSMEQLFEHPASLYTIYLYKIL